jgi:predicted ATPase with chaperone activity
MLAASEQIERDQLDRFMMVGELALDGVVRPVKPLHSAFCSIFLNGLGLVAQEWVVS